MPTFGEFETVGEPIAVTEYRGHVTTVWRARKLGTQTDPAFAVKTFVPHRRKAGTSEAEEALEKDHGLEFLDGVKQLKKAQAEGGRSLCPVHAFGLVDGGAWYATDFYPRNTLKAWIARRGSVDGAALAQVVRCVCAAGLALKRARGYSHGNLKAANIFLVGKPRPLRQTPLELGDIYPTGAVQMARLEGAESQAAKELLGDVMEVQDLRALGELLLQLVEGRLVSSAYDYNYPIAPSPAWERLGREADRWRELCNRLLDPQLSLGKLNLETLAQEFRPSAVATKLPMLAGAIGVIVLLAGGAIYFATRPRLPTVAAPVSTPADGTFTESVSVVLNTPTPEAVIYYTLDDSEPTTNATRYTQALVFTETRTIRAKAFAPEHKPSATLKARFEVGPAQVVAQPAFTPAPGTYPDLVTVTLASATPGATIYYTTNEADPTPSALRYNRPIPLTNTTTVKARAFANGQKDSAIVSGRYAVIARPVAVPPAIKPDGGGYRDAVVVELSTTTPGATIYYTTNGLDPTPEATRYTRPFTLTHSATVKAKAAANNYKDSPPASAMFNVAATLVVTTPTISPASGSYKDEVTVSLACATSGATIYYTTNGIDPTANATRYVRPFLLTNSATVKARAFVTGQRDSAIGSAVFSVTTMDVAVAPTIKPEDGNHRDSVQVELTTPTPGAAIYYTTNGLEPTAQSLRYVRPFLLTNTTTVKARALANNYKDSPTASATFTVSVTQIAVAPTISPASGGYKDEVTVRMESTTPGATIYYTTDGTEPTTSATRYNAPFKLTETKTVTARTFAPNYNPSQPVRASYAVTPTPVAIMPVIRPEQRNHLDSVTVTLESTTPGATIYYTLDGSNPTTASARYQQPFPLTESKTVKALAVAREYRDSPVASAEFTVRATPVTVAPTITPNGGAFADIAVVRLQSTPTGAAIYFTLDGTDPTTNSARYQQPLALTESATMKALAWVKEHKLSPITRADFIVTNSPLVAIAPARTEVVAGQSVQLKLAGSGPGGIALNYRVQTPSASDKGRLSEVSGGVVTYTAAEAGSGEDSFTFVVTDGRRESPPARVLLKIVSKLDQLAAMARQALEKNDLVAAQKIVNEVFNLNAGSDVARTLGEQWKNKVLEILKTAEAHRLRGEYEAALLLCEKHKGVKDLEEFASRLSREQGDWNYAFKEFAKGEDYEFVDKLKNNSSYAAQSPLRELLAQATAEATNYTALAELAHNPANWKIVRGALNKLPATTLKKKLFLKLDDWAKNQELGEHDKQLKELQATDQQLADWNYFLKSELPRWFNGKSSAGIIPHSGDLPQSSKRQINLQLDSIEGAYGRLPAVLDAGALESRKLTVRELRDNLLFRN